MIGRRLRPVPRARVALALLAFLIGIGGIVTLAETLRHPLPSGGPATPELDDPDSDPRTTVDCGQAPPREGQERSEDEPDGTRVVLSVTSNRLYDCPELYDGERVRYRGEVVGAVLQRDDGAWVQLNDDVYAETLGPLPAHRDYRGGNAGVGVFVPHDLANQINWVGGPQTRGDVLEVTGVFNRVDLATAEVAIIRAETGTVAEVGEAFPDPVLADRSIVAVIVSVIAIGFTVAERIVSRRR